MNEPWGYFYGGKERACARLAGMFCQLLQYRRSHQSLDKNTILNLSKNLKDQIQIADTKRKRQALSLPFQYCKKTNLE